MKVTLTSFIAFSGFFAAVLGSPIEAPDLEARDTDVKAMVVNLYSGIQEQTRIINETVDGINEHSTAAQNASAQGRISSASDNIVSQINDAQQATSRSLRARGGSYYTYSHEDQIIIKHYTQIIIYECAGTYQKVNYCYGEGYSKGLLYTIFDALKGLFTLLDKIIDGVLDLAVGLINGLLKTVFGLLGSILNLLFGGWGWGHHY
ncbi:hypothetical protein PVAG01_07805 [Phlyctema vagabunda]|uniref:Uncharacterized protein n=1 Tax=Phlyctema vagabunda TaxID=108571 RepID=A0ABR4PDG4_9HELO